ncbi:MAG: arginine--tRNA ligase [Gammaproteobacteria bacterium]|nr:arginine--tRNA ligase [Gammaproteobacteria bacterium]MBT6734219.1 arginine--tRNA ligase [Gammaproteobacteria bacterium]
MNIEIKNIIESYLLETTSDENINPREISKEGYIEVQKTTNELHGDYYSNIAMKLSKVLKKNPVDIGEDIKKGLLGRKHPQIKNIEIKKPGFINFFIEDSKRASIVTDIIKNNNIFEKFKTKIKKNIHIEFVSANPTGPLHVGHGRGLIFGKTLSNMLRIQGHNVFTEYYVNNIGKQIDILSISVILSLIDLKRPFDDVDIYKGKYISTVANKLKLKYRDLLLIHKDSLSGNKVYESFLGSLKKDFNSYLVFRDTVIDIIINDYIKKDLEDLNVQFSNWFHESELIKDNFVYQILEKIKSKGLSYVKDGAVWFKSTKYGDDKDRVLVRANSALTYFATDIAYHSLKLDKYDHIINIWGSDHHGYVPRLTNALKGIGYDTDKMSIHLIQFANLYRDGEKMSMSTRSGEFITLKSLADEIGPDAINFFYINKKIEQHLDFEINTALSKDKDNPVYYIQYAHARIEKIIQKVSTDNLNFDDRELIDPKEQELLRLLNSYVQTIEQAMDTLQPQLITNYLYKLSQSFHSYYANVKIIGEEINYSRVSLVMAVQKILKNGLNLFDISAPEDM